MALCAGCGLAIRNGDKISTQKYFVLHRGCTTIPVDSWTITRLIRGSKADQSARVATLEAHVATLEVGLADASRRLDLAEETTGQVARLRRLVHELEDLNHVQSAQIAHLRASRDRERSLHTRPGVSDLERQAFGLAVGRGVWGFAALSMRLAMDSKDDAEARYALLELR